MDNIRKYQTEVTELKNTMTKLKNNLEGFNNRLDEGSVHSKTRQWDTPNQTSKKKKGRKVCEVS